VKCHICKQTKEGLTWIVNADGRLAVCDTCLDELNTNRGTPSGDEEPQSEIA